MRRMGRNLCACSMQVELLSSEAQGKNAAVAERLSPHPERFVEPDGRIDIGNRQNQVIERPDAHARTLARCFPASLHRGAAGRSVGRSVYIVRARQVRR